MENHPRWGDLGIFSFMNGSSSQLLEPAPGYAVEPLLTYPEGEETKAAAVLAHVGQGRVLALGDCGCFLNGTVGRIPENKKFFGLLFDLVASRE